MSTWLDLRGKRTLRGVRTDVRHLFDNYSDGIAVDLGDITVLAFEDANDGYRSCCPGPLISRVPLSSLAPHSEYLNVPVLVKLWSRDDNGGVAEGIEILDRRNGKTVVQIGTRNYDDYYPVFTANYYPQNIAENTGTK